MSGEENQFTVQGCNIVTILKRLEAATSRLEDIMVYQTQADKAQARALQQGGVSTQADEAPKQLQDVKTSTEDSGSYEKSKSVIEFEKLISDYVKTFVDKSSSIGAEVAESANELLDAFKSQAKFLEVVSISKKPDFSDPKFLSLLNPINLRIGKINQIKDENRKSEFSNHLSTISEGSPMLGWIVSETPVSLIPEFKGSAQFWSNRILKDYKEKDQKHVDWVNSFLQIIDNLRLYVKEFHATGPSWNAHGKPLEEAISKFDTSSQAQSKPAQPEPPKGGAPPPPPPPPLPSQDFFDDSSKSTKSTPGGINAVFADINKGEGITSGLRKVDKSEMTHKNPTLRSSEPLNKKVTPKPPKKPQSLSSGSVPTKKPPKKELIDDTKWIINNFTEEDVSEPITIEAEKHQSIFVGNCSGVTLNIKGKANAISVSQAKKTALIVDSLISGIDIIKSSKFGLQILGTVPMVNVDKSDEGSIYLSKDSIESDVQIFSSCSTSLNINVPEKDDYEELPVPEQFKHTIKNGKLQSEVVEHKG